MYCDLKNWNWNDFDVFDDTINHYMLARGEGNTMASQTVTAVNKLVYKFFNDGDVFDNNYVLEGWCNDISSYANWLANHVNGAEEVLDRICKCTCCDDYAELLYDLCIVCLGKPYLEYMSNFEKVGSIYEEEGKYNFVERSYEEEDYEEEEEVELDEE